MILYLSGTGNTRWVAERIARMTGEERVVDVAFYGGRLPRISLSAGEPLGIFYPVHGWRSPKFLRTVLQNLSVDVSSRYADKSLFYAVCTVGDTVGESMDILRKDLERRGIPLDATFDVRMPNTYVGLPFMDVDSKDVEKKKLAEAEKRLEFIAGKIKAGEHGAFMSYIGRWKRINSRLLGEAFARWLVTDGYFRIDAERCISCGRCAKSCPVGNIVTDKDGFPQWRRDGRCMACFACYHNCPRHAVCFGSMTTGKGQYVFKAPLDLD